jgi:hypothetical protein
MKRTILLLSVFMLASCSLFEKAKVKEKLSDLIGKEAKKTMLKEYANPAFEGMSCSEEAEKSRVNLVLEMDKLLKVERNKMAGLSVGELVCEGLVSKVAPMLFERHYDQYPCAVKAFGIRADGFASKVCSALPLGGDS